MTTTICPTEVTSKPPWVVRPATNDDLPALDAIEKATFETDRMSKRAFKRFLNSPGASCLVAIDETNRLIGYGLVLFRANTSLARLYSITTEPSQRVKGVGSAILSACEATALARNVATMRLEVAEHNQSAIALYKRFGYREFALYPHYYEDDSNAIRMQKSLLPRTLLISSKVRHYAQRLDFTCGPCALMMAMHALDSSTVMSLSEEIAIWREATTIFMTSGHGGCGPHGLALAADRRGFASEVWVNDENALFTDTVRTLEKKQVLELVHENFRAEIKDRAIPEVYGNISLSAIEEKYRQGFIPLVLISQYRLHGEKAPHWVTISAIDDRFVYICDPDSDIEEAPFGDMDCLSTPIFRQEFEIMSKYGKSRLQAVVFVGPK